MKRDRSGSSLKKKSFLTQVSAATFSVKDYKFEQVFYEAGLEPKGKDKYSAYIKHIINLPENIQLVDPLQLCTWSMSREAPSLLASSQK